MESTMDNESTGDEKDDVGPGVDAPPVPEVDEKKPSEELPQEKKVEPPVQRLGRGERKEVLEKRFKKPSRQEAKQMKKEMKKNVKKMEREMKVKTVNGQKAISKTKEGVQAITDAGYNLWQKAIKQHMNSMIIMRDENLEGLGFAEMKELKVNSVLFAAYRQRFEHMIQEISVMGTMICLPVFTSNMYLILNGEHCPAVMDCLKVREYYAIVTKLFGSMDWVKSYKNVAFESLKSGIQKRLWSSSQLKETLKCFVMQTDCDVMKDELVEKYENGKVGDKEMEYFRVRISSIDPKEWPFVEDDQEDYYENVLNFIEEEMITYNDNMNKTLSSLGITEESTAEQIHDRLEEVTVAIAANNISILNCFEVCIARIYGKERIPFNYRTNLITIPDIPKEIPAHIAKTIAENRYDLFRARQAFADSNVSVERMNVAELEIEKSLKDVSLMDRSEVLPNAIEIKEYLKFQALVRQIHTETEEQIQKRISLMNAVMGKLQIRSSAEEATN